MKTLFSILILVISINGYGQNLMRLTSGKNTSKFNQFQTAQHQKDIFKFEESSELRLNDGSIIRVGNDAELTVVDSPFGKTPAFYGEFFCKGCDPNSPYNPVAGPKYRTSCWNRRIGPDPIDYFIKNINKTQDKIFALSGNQIITEYDENNKEFIICSLEPGEMAVLTFDNSKPMRERYSCKIEKISNKDYDYILNKFYDPRHWIK